jgi:hypothetical protein
VGLLTLCICCMWSPLLQFYGGAAQDFGPLRPLWESYGWSLFRLQNPPAESNLEYVKIQVSRSKSWHALPALLLKLGLVVCRGRSRLLCMWFVQAAL